MKKFFLTSLLLAGCVWQTQAQNCANGRYQDQIFTDFTLTSDILYGENVNVNGQNQTLSFDLYEPTGDLEPTRPLIIFAHGGGFTTGDKTNDEVTQFCRSMAKRGYVTASIQYRLGLDVNGLINPTRELIRATARAVQDGKGLVRFFRRSVVENGNPYKIDTNHIYFGGSSAGGFLSLHLAFLDDISKVGELTDSNALDDLGGLEGTSGNPGYSSKVHGVINMCGALGKAHWMDASNTVPLLNIGATADAVVPYKTGNAQGIVPVEGPYLIDSMAQVLGTYSSLLTFVGQGHVPYAGGGAYADTTDWYIRDRMYPLICATARDSKLADEVGLTVGPNPAGTRLTVRMKDTKPFSVNLLDLSGRVVWTAAEQVGESIVPRNGLSAGVYALQVRTADGRMTSKTVVFE